MDGFSGKDKEKGKHPAPALSALPVLIVLVSPVTIILDRLFAWIVVILHHVAVIIRVDVIIFVVLIVEVIVITVVIVQIIVQVVVVIIVIVVIVIVSRIVNVHITLWRWIIFVVVAAADNHG
ncbi:hypothetical protein [Mesobacillus zeae]|uniref:hypothetical protein n=1 Tax=Mesobacillus zeae TaxID=1917180 RepID=UPI0015E72324|nr:hypothetical protein [Mesobacillus zeae]